MDIDPNEFHEFNPYEYEKELYICVLKDGTETIGYPNAGKMTDMKRGMNNITDKLLKVKLHPDGWEAMTGDKDNEN